MSDWKNNISRVPRPRLAAGRSYDRISRVYDFVAGPSEARFRNLGLEMLAPQFGECALEIGSGTGHGLVSFVKNIGETGQVTGIDLSWGMIEVAKKRVRKKGATAIPFTCGDALYLPYVNDHFDIVFLCFVLELFDTPDILPVLNQVRRVLRPGGRLGVISLGKAETWPVRLYEWGHKKFPHLLDCRPILSLPAVQQAGFAVEQYMLQKMWGLPVDMLVGVKPE